MRVKSIGATKILKILYIYCIAFLHVSCYIDNFNYVTFWKDLWIKDELNFYLHLAWLHVSSLVIRCLLKIALRKISLEFLDILKLRIFEEFRSIFGCSISIRGSFQHVASCPLKRQMVHLNASKISFRNESCPLYPRAIS